mgnify:FL=1
MRLADLLKADLVQTQLDLENEEMLAVAISAEVHPMH